MILETASLAQTVLTETQLILTGLLIGVIVAAPVGPVNVLCIQRTLERGFWAGVAAGFGAVLGDGVIAAAAAFGVTAISNITTDYRITIQLSGGSILLLFGVRLYFAAPRTGAQGSRWAELRRIAETIPDMFRPMMRYQIWRIVPHASVIPQSFFLTVTNPGAILGMFAIFGGLGSLTGGLTSYLEAFTLVLAVMGGSLLWWIGLSHIISTVRHKLDEDRLQRINQIAGGVLVGFGVLLIGQLIVA
jgi:threonine/homoserine/homoserine lactone efflux protein